MRKYKGYDKLLYFDGNSLKQWSYLLFFVLGLLLTHLNLLDLVWLIGPHDLKGFESMEEKHFNSHVFE